MTTTADEKEIGDFTNEEIRDEFIERFGDPDDADLEDFMSSDLIEELERRGKMPPPELPDGYDEAMDLIAEAARTSRHAARAYDILRDAFPDEPSRPTLSDRQQIIAGRMKDAA